jgi:hypothetical protein
MLVGVDIDAYTIEKQRKQGYSSLLILAIPA